MNTSISKKNTQQLHSTRQKGISTVQVAIGIMVSVIVLLGAIGGYQYVNQGKVNNEISALSDLKVATVKYGATFGSLTGLTLSQMNTFGFFGNSALSYSSASGGSVTNQWGGSVSVASSSAGSITYQFNSVPQSACIDLLGKADSIADSIIVGSTTVKSLGTTTNASSATSACVSPSVNISYVISK